MIFDVNVEYNKTTTKTITNEHKKGNLTVYKVDKDNNRIALGGVTFDLYSEEFKKVIGTYTTDENPTAQRGIKFNAVSINTIPEKISSKMYLLLIFSLQYLHFPPRKI